MASLFESARSRPAEEREALLEACARDEPDLVRSVRRLLAQHERADGPLSDPVALPTPGKDGPAPPSINQYRVIRQIGSGGMGVVYLAEQDKPRREVALKVIRPGLIAPGLLRRFDLEASMLGRLRHPGVAQIHEAGTYDDGSGARPFFAMEYVDGSPLPEYAEEKRLGTRERIELMARICAAVHHAHQQGVIHRDLKPGNILVDRAGCPKILDFGVAKAADPELRTVHTIAGELVGTVGYMSPEQIAGDPMLVDTRTDIHALGVILFELLTGRLPYEVEGAPLATAIQRIREDAPARLGAIHPSLRGDLETICRTAIEKDKARRYQSASGLEADLRRFLRHEPIAARPPSTLYLLSRFARRNRALVAAVLVALASLVALLIATTVGVFAVARQRDDAIAAMREANAANEFLGDVLSSLDPRERASPTVTLEDFLEGVAGRLEAGQLAGQPRVEAAVRGTIGVAFRTLGSYERSREQYETALALLREHDPGNTVEIAGVTGGLALVHMRAGRTEQAETLLEAARALIDPPGAPIDADRKAIIYRADVLQHLAQLRTEQRRLDEAEQLIGRALDLRRAAQPERPELLARSLNALAVILRLKGDAEGARSAYRQALAILRADGARPGLDLATTLNNLALLHLYQGESELAIPLLDETLRLRCSILPPGHTLIAQTLNSLGGARQLAGDPDGAADAYRHALDIRVATLGGDHPAVATIRVNLGVILSELGRHDDAIEQLETALDARSAAYAPRDERVAAARLHLGRALLAAGKLPAAEAMVREAIDAYAEAGREIELATARSVLGVCLVRLDRFREGEAELLRAFDALAGETTGAGARVREQTLGALLDLYDAWHRKSPDQGHDRTRALWRALAGPHDDATAP